MAQDLSRLRAFVQVYEAGGFSAAARAHGKSKALLSKYVTDLEDHLGVRLMNRTTRKLSLTRAGEDYFRDVSGLLLQLDELDASVADDTGEPHGPIRVSAPRNLGETGLAEAIFAFLQRHEGVSVDLRLEDRLVDLAAEGIDLALRISAMPDSAMITRKLAETCFAVVGSPALIARTGLPKSPEDLRGKPAIIDTNMTGQSNWRFVNAEGASFVHVDGRVKVNSPLAAREAALAGLGYAVIPLYLVHDLIDEGRLVQLFEHSGMGPMSLQAVYLHRRHLPTRVRALIDHLVDWYAERPLL